MNKTAFTIFTLSLASLLSACSHKDATFPSLLADDSQEEFHRNKNQELTPYQPVVTNVETFIGKKIEFLRQDLEDLNNHWAQLQKSANKNFAEQKEDLTQKSAYLLKTIKEASRFKDICPEEQSSLHKLQAQTETLLNNLKAYRTQAPLNASAKPVQKKINTAPTIIKAPIKPAQETTLSAGQDKPILTIKLYNEHTSYQEALRTVIKSTLKQKGKSVQFYVLNLSAPSQQQKAQEHQQIVIKEMENIGVVPQQIHQDSFSRPDFENVEIRIFAK